MDSITIKPSTTKGAIAAPPSKSYEQRYLAAALLAGEDVRLSGFSNSNDTTSAMEVITRLGATITPQAGDIIVKGVGGEIAGGTSISIGESGLATRLFAPIAAMGTRPTIISGHGSILIRPMEFIKKPLETLGARIQLTNQKYLPLAVSGPLIGGVADVDGSVGSQFLSGLLFALPLAEQNSVLNVQKLTSRPYIQMTIAVLEEFGIQIQNQEYQKFIIAGKQKYTPPKEITPKGDWSSASCLLVAGAIAGEIEVQNLVEDPCQADSALLQALRNAGAKVEILPKSIRVSKPEEGLRGFTFDATQCPDLFPALAALAAGCRPGERSKIHGTTRLAHKESNRSLTIAEEFAKAGVKIDISAPDTMLIEAAQNIKAAKYSSHNDHRIAMATAVIALIADGESTIENPQAVKKSYPKFWNDISQITAK